METFIFDNSTRDFVLDVFDKKIDEEGYIVERKGGNRVITPKGMQIKADEFAGVTYGSEIFLTNDLPSLLEYADQEAYCGQQN